MAKKFCSKCNQLKDSTEFYRGCVCKPCFYESYVKPHKQPNIDVNTKGREAIQLIRELISAKTKKCKTDLMCTISDMEKFLLNIHTKTKREEV